MSKLGNTDNLSSNQENVVLSGVKDQWPLVWPRGGVEAGSGDHSSGSGWRREYSQPEIIYFSHIVNRLSSYGHKSKTWNWSLIFIQKALA